VSLTNGVRGMVEEDFQQPPSVPSRKYVDKIVVARSPVSGLAMTTTYATNFGDRTLATSGTRRLRADSIAYEAAVGEKVPGTLSILGVLDFSANGRITKRRRPVRVPKGGPPAKSPFRKEGVR